MRAKVTHGDGIPAQHQQTTTKKQQQKQRTPPKTSLRVQRVHAARPDCQQPTTTAAATTATNNHIQSEKRTTVSTDWSPDCICDAFRRTRFVACAVFRGDRFSLRITGRFSRITCAREYREKNVCARAGTMPTATRTERVGCEMGKCHMRA